MSSAPSDPKANVKPSDIASIETDVARLSVILSSDNITDNEQEISENNLAELLKQMESANGVMDGVEGKLDSVLGQLDSLLDALEKKEKKAQVDDPKTTES